MLGRNVLVTGGAGFLARALYRYARAQEWECEFTALSRDDAKHAALQQRYPEVETIPWDVRQGDERLTYLMRGFDTVIHAAASKYVDRAELNAVDTIETNVEGSMNVIGAAMAAGVDTVIGISTDKAVEPRNIYGATKMVMERAFADLSGLTETRLICVRYGNVIGSTGSVVPLFQQQLAETGKIRVTDQRMTRFWMTPLEALRTIETAYKFGQRGSVTVPSPRALPMSDVIRAVLGFNDRHPIPEDRIEVIGMRPGEKMHESLIHEAESIRTVQDATGHYYQILPPGTQSMNDAFTIRSDNPPGGLIGIEEFRREFEAAAEL